MIDDTMSVYKDSKNVGVEALLMDTNFNREEGYNRVYTWKEIYEYIHKIQK